MDETIIRGLIMGGVLGLVGWVATLVWRVIRSPSEGARRFRLVAGISLAAFTIYIAATEGSLIGLVIVVAIIGAGVWIAKGTARK